jgi:hypothetical protein
MEVVERPNSIGRPDRFYAKFENTYIKGDGVVIGTFGNGATEAEAIAAYAEEISEKTLVIDPFNQRRELPVPRLK